MCAAPATPASGHRAAVRIEAITEGGGRAVEDAAQFRHPLAPLFRREEEVPLDAFVERAAEPRVEAVVLEDPVGDGHEGLGPGVVVLGHRVTGQDVREPAEPGARRGCSRGSGW
ncbi:hypothetical protein GCM10020000_12630 [Streptomyces olivoverticillatus]